MLNPNDSPLTYKTLSIVLDCGGQTYMILTHSETRTNVTVSKKHEYGQIHSSLPARILLDGDAVTSGGEHLSTPNGDQFTALISARHVVEHSSVVDKGVEFPAGHRRTEKVTWFLYYHADMSVLFV